MVHRQPCCLNENKRMARNRFRKVYRMNRRVKLYPRGRELSNTVICFTLTSADENGMEIAASSLDRNIRRNLVETDVDRRGNVIHTFRCRGNERANSILSHYRAISRRRRRAGLYHQDSTAGVDLHGAIASGSGR
jgi:hypothetical protein